MAPSDLEASSNHPMTKYTARLADMCLATGTKGGVELSRMPFEMVGHRMQGVPGRPPFKFYTAAAAPAPADR